MNLRFLETFVWLAKLRNFRVTAEKLHTTQAAVSSRIATLEQDFGARLFDRGSREVTLTQDGTKVLVYAERILKLAQEMQREVSDRESISGTVRIGVIEAIVHSWLPRLIERIRQEFPKLAIELTSDTTIHLGEQLKKGHLDVILQAESVLGSAIANVELGRYPMRWIASPRLGIADELLDLLDLAVFPIISFSRDSGPHKATVRSFAELPVDAVQINCINSIAAIIRLAVDGFGVAVVPPAIIQRELLENQLRLLKVRQAPPELVLIASYRSGLDSPLAELIARMAQQVTTEYALVSGPEMALLPKAQD